MNPVCSVFPKPALTCMICLRWKKRTFGQPKPFRYSVIRPENGLVLLPLHLEDWTRLFLQEASEKIALLFAPEFVIILNFLELNLRKNKTRQTLRSFQQIKEKQSFA